MISKEMLSQPISPAAVARRAQECDTPEQRDLIFWLQARSVATRGVGPLALQFIADHPGVKYSGGCGWYQIGTDEAKVQAVARYFLESCCLSGEIFTSSAQGYFSDHSASIDRSMLAQWRDKLNAATRARYVETTIGRTVFASLTSALQLKRLIAIEGPPGYGKSHAARVWTELNAGSARYLRLSGITNKRGFFHTVLSAFGFTGIDQAGADRLQRTLQHFLRESRLMLIIDEAQNLLPAKEHSTKRPELLDWLAGATYDEGVPCALLTWADFTTRRVAAEKQTSWKAEHLSRRIARYVRLDAPPTKDDFRKIALALVPTAKEPMLDILVGYAVASRHYVSALVDIIAEAGHAAARRGGQMNFADVKTALLERQASDAAQVEALGTAVMGRRLATPAAPALETVPALPAPRGLHSAPPLPLPPNGRRMAAPLPAQCNAAAE